MNLQSLAADHFGAAYRAAMAAISDADVRFRVEKLFYHAGNLVWHPDDDGTLGRESVVEELLAFASNSSALCDSLVRIVEHWPRKREWLATYWLASRVVGTLLVEGKLSPDHLTLAVRGMTETYLCSLNLDRTYPAKMYKLAWMFLDEMDPAFCVLRYRMTEVLLREAYVRLCDDPVAARGLDGMFDGALGDEDRIMIA
jgi:hypothetical protein